MTMQLDPLIGPRPATGGPDALPARRQMPGIAYRSLPINPQ